MCFFYKLLIGELMTKIVYYTAVDANLTVFAQAYKKLNKKEVSLKVYHRRSLQSQRQIENLKNDLKDADFFLIQLMGGKNSMRDFDQILKELAEKIKVYIYGTTAEIEELREEYSNFNEVEKTNIFKYFYYGGVANIYQLLRYLANLKNEKQIDPLPAKELPMAGIYYESPNKKNIGGKTIGITFYRNYFINGDCKFVDSLIKNIEEKGHRAKALYVSTVNNEDKASTEEVLNKYFKDQQDKENIDVLINLLMFSNGNSEKLYLGALDLPVIQGILNTDSLVAWESENYGLNPSILTIGVALPEVDGSIISLPIASKEIRKDQESGIDIISYEPIEERVDKIVDLANNYANLRLKNNKDKKLAIIFHNYPPTNENIGCAYGLDSMASVFNILEALEIEGYSIDKTFENSEEIIKNLMARVTNDENWTDDDKISKTIKLPLKSYREFYENLDVSVRSKIEDFWGQTPGTCLVGEDEEILIPGIINGNIFIGIQPQRNNKMDTSSTIHSPDIPLGHHYYGYYQWIKNVFKADAIIHIGKHGSLDWLPGKAVALSKYCHPDLAIDTLPNFYPYIINNPGEGTQAKRRSYACLLSHLEPVMDKADLYDDYYELEKAIDEYIDNKRFDREISQSLYEKINSLIESTGLSNDLDPNIDFEDKLNYIHSYLEEMKDNLIADGLHIFGQSPQGERKINFINSLMRIPSKDSKSIRELMLKKRALDLDDLLEERKNGDLKAKQEAKKTLEEVESEAKDFIKAVLEKKANESLDKDLEILQAQVEKISRDLDGTDNEINNLIRGLSGFFVPPGPSGSPTRGQVEILPTGKNFYTINPKIIPSESAWNTGVKLAETLLDTYKRENDGAYPESIGYVLFASPTIRSKGEDIGQILYLLGARPKYKRGTNLVAGFEIIPLEELKRPRIDVTIRITGFFRDAFMNLVEYIDEVINEIALLDESIEDNFIKKHFLEDLNLFLDQDLDEEEAKRRSLFRIFSAKEGAYGTGVNTLINGKSWEEKKTLADTYLEYGGYAYGKNIYGTKARDIFKSKIEKIDLAVKNIDTKETDVLINDDNYSYLGGMVAAAKTYGKSDLEAYVGDSSDPQRVEIKNIAEETRFVIRSKVLNPKWYDSLKRHGFRGAGEISAHVDHFFGWDATTEIIDDFTYQQIKYKFVDNEDFAKWMESVNPWARQNIIERLLEAIKRGLWQADERTKDDLIKKYLENEGILEE